MSVAGCGKPRKKNQPTGFFVNVAFAKFPTKVSVLYHFTKPEFPLGSLTFHQNMDWRGSYLRLPLFHQKNCSAMMNAVPYPTAAESSEPIRGARAIPFMPEYSIVPLLQQAAGGSHGKSGKIVLPTMEGLCFEKVK